MNNPQHFRQGTNIYETPLSDVLNSEYFKAEPRTTVDWLRSIQYMCEHHADLKQVLPPGISLNLLSQYIRDPRGTSNRFTAEEMSELQTPLRVTLFYFLRKLAQYEGQNAQLITRINNLLFRELFSERPIPGYPDRGVVSIDHQHLQAVAIKKGAFIQAQVPGEKSPRTYQTITPIVGHTIKLDHCLLSAPFGKHQLNLVHFELPLKQRFTPFSPYLSGDRLIFEPSVIIRSPLLSLQEGRREILLTLELQKHPLEPLRFQISTSEGWRTINPGKAVRKEQLEVTSQIHYRFSLRPDEQAINPIDEGDNIVSTTPGIRIFGLVNNKIIHTSLKVTTRALTPRAIRNQDQVLILLDKIVPFGLDAPRNAAFTFTHPQLNNAFIVKMTLQPEWVALPENLNQYYKAYHKKKEDFTVSIHRLQFNGKNHTQHELVTKTTLFTQPIAFSVSGNIPATGEWEEEESDPLLQPTAYQMTLNGADFGHQQYPLLMANYAIEKAKYENTSIKFLHKAPIPVNVPYTPMLSSFLINYTTKRVQWRPQEQEANIELLRNTPFGYQTYTGETIELGEDQSGALYLGFSALKKERAASFYVHGIAGNPSTPQAKIIWYFLSDDQWQVLTHRYVLYDGTEALTRPGIFYWIPPPSMSKSNTLMPHGVYWLKAVVSGQEAAHTAIKQAYILDSHPTMLTIDGLIDNAFLIEQSAESMSSTANYTPMPAGSNVTYPEASWPFQLTLPYDTTGILAPEKEPIFWCRIANLTRNDNRMVTVRDFEDILLQNFRFLILVKCLPRKAEEDLIKIVVAPRLHHNQYLNKIDPGSFALPFISNRPLRKMEAFARKLSSPFFHYNINLQLTNPNYIWVGFALHLQYQGNRTVAANNRQLYHDLQYFLNPWLFEKENIPRFGNWIDSGTLFTYLLEQPYIQTIYGIKIGKMVNGQLDFRRQPAPEPDQVWVMPPQHGLMVFFDENGFRELGIGLMVINWNFEVSNHPH